MRHRFALASVVEAAYNKQIDLACCPRWNSVVCIPSQQQSFVSKSISHGPLQVKHDNAIVSDAVAGATHAVFKTGLCA